MNRKIMLICSVALSATLFTTGVYASQTLKNEIKGTENSEITQLQEAVENSNVLRSRYSVTSYEDEISELDNDSVQTYSNDEENSFDEMLNVENAIKVYDVNLSETTTSLSEQFDNDAEIILLPELIDNEISFVFMKKGQNIDEATEKINALNLSDERKEKMISKAAEKAGKWNVSYIKKYSSSESAANFVNISFIQNLLNTNNIFAVENFEYIYINNNEMLGVWVKTESAEYVIPFVTTTRVDDLSNNNVYSLDNIVSYIVK